MKKKTKLLALLGLIAACVGGFAACEMPNDGSSGSEALDGCKEHAWGRHYVFIAPTEETDGEVLYACDNCNLVKMEKLSPDGDEDNDTLTNYEEVVIHQTDPYLEDTDGDHLLDEEEINLFHTNPAKYDSDEDGLSDFDEFIYETDPMNPDTDGDGLFDGKEIEYGFDPKTAEESFNVVIKPEEVEDTVDPSLEMEADGEILNTLTVQPDDFFTEDTMGYMGKAYAYQAQGEIQSAKITFAFDETTVSPDAELVIYDFDAEKREMKPLMTTVEGNVASAEISELSTYILLDRRVYEEEFKWVDTWETNKSYSELEVVFVIDDSGSLGGDYSYNSTTKTFSGGNDPTHERLSVARDFLDKLHSSAKAGIVKFDDSTYKFTNELVVCDEIGKETLSNYLQFTYNGGSYTFDSCGSTYMYSAIQSSFSLFESSGDDTMKVMIVFSDGVAHDENLHSQTISQAQANNVMIYTVGLGESSSSYFTDYMKPLAEETGAKFYMSSEADGLASIYENIKEKMDIQTDSDNDGLSDYYEENMVVFAGIGYELDKTVADTDGDGLLDGEEVKTVTVFNDDGTKMTVLGRVFSDPTETDSDKDGINDKQDRYPLDYYKY